MRTPTSVAALLAATMLSPLTIAGTHTYFNPLTQSSAVATPNHVNELNSPWQAPAGLHHEKLTNMRKIEADPTQSVLRAPNFGNPLFAQIASMWDMVAFDDSGKFLFIPHETFVGAGVSRYDIENDRMENLFAGDAAGIGGDWSNDYAAFDPATWTPNRTIYLAEEWSGEGRVIEVLNPFADAADIETREVQSLPNLSHEGLRFSGDGRTLYMIDEWNSGSIYKFVARRRHDYAGRGQLFVLSVNAFDGEPADLWNDPANESATRTGPATWVPLTDRDGTPLTTADPFLNGPTNDPRTNDDTRGGRPAADEVGGTPYGRPEDLEVGRLRNGREVVYFTATSERAIYSIEMRRRGRAMVRLMASADTPRNEGFPATTGVLDAPDNLAQDALGNIYVIEDAPNSGDVGGDVWFIRDVNNDGVAESLDHFLSIQVGGAEHTGMIFNPKRPTQFVLSVQHPLSTNLDVGEDAVPDGFGDALWTFDLTDIVPPPCPRNLGHQARHRDINRRLTCSRTDDFRFIDLLKKAGKFRDDDDDDDDHDD